MYQTQCSSASEYSTGRDHELEVYPHIERLCEDFGLVVVEGVDAREAKTSSASAVSLAVNYVEKTQYLTPLFASMRQLEAFVADNMVDILHGYLCGDVEPS
jgi:hypothetical protein